MRLYVAGGRDSWAGIRQFMREAEERGYQLAFDWSIRMEEVKNGAVVTLQELKDTARDEALGVARADAVVVFPGGPGTNGEFGMALARGKLVIVIRHADYTEQMDGVVPFTDFQMGLVSVFYLHPDVRIATREEVWAILDEYRQQMPKTLGGKA